MQSSHSATPVLDLPQPKVANGLYDSYRRMRDVISEEKTGQSSTSKVTTLRSRMLEIKEIEEKGSDKEKLAAWRKILGTIWDDILQEVRILEKENILKSASKAFWHTITFSGENTIDVYLKTSIAVRAYIISKIQAMLKSESKDDNINALKKEIAEDHKEIEALRIKIIEEKAEGKPIDDTNVLEKNKRDRILKLVKLGDKHATIMAMDTPGLLPVYRKLPDAAECAFNPHLHDYLQFDFHQYFVRKVIRVHDHRGLDELQFKQFEHNILISHKRGEPTIPGSTPAAATEESKTQTPSGSEEKEKDKEKEREKEKDKDDSIQVSAQALLAMKKQQAAEQKAKGSGKAKNKDKEKEKDKNASLKG